MKLSVLDYGIGNLRSVDNALRVIGAENDVTRDPARLAESDGLIVPGVGAFGHCVANLRDMDLVGEVRKYVQSGRPVLGICVGMQMLFEHSTEFGHHEGLRLIPGIVDRIDAVGGKVDRLPHIAWSGVEAGAAGAAMFAGIEPADRRFYFVHSYTARNVPSQFVAGMSDYDSHPVVAAVVKDNVWGTQFHPEKSGRSGLRLLANFAASCQSKAAGKRSEATA